MRKYFYIAIAIVITFIFLDRESRPDVVSVKNNKYYFDDNTFAEVYYYETEIRYRRFTSNGKIIESGNFYDGEFYNDNAKSLLNFEISISVLAILIAWYLFVFLSKDRQIIFDFIRKIKQDRFADLSENEKLNILYTQLRCTNCKDSPNMNYLSDTSKGGVNYIKVHCNTCKDDLEFRLD